jgi:hypothetical protein
MELLAIWQGDLSGVCFTLSEMGVEGAGEGDFIGERYARVWSGGDGAGDTRQYVRQGEGGPVAGDDGGGGCAAKGAGAAVVVRCKGGRGGDGSVHGGGHACRGHG